MYFVNCCTFEYCLILHFSGCKLNDVAIVYTPWTNLKKSGDMDVGQVGFHSSKLVSFLTGNYFICV